MLVNVTCTVCGKTFQRNKSEADRVIAKGQSQYCSKECQALGRVTSVTYNCDMCGKEVTRTKYQYDKIKTGKHFCSHSCAAKYNNLGVPRNQPKDRLCIECGAILSRDEYSRKAKYCKNCNPQNVDWSIVTFEQLIESKGLFEANNQIRRLSRRAYDKSDKPKQCLVCGYDKHYEVAHVKGVATFSKDTLISEINDLDNLAALCPNHHWEHDEGLLTLKRRGNELLTETIENANYICTQEGNTIRVLEQRYVE